MSWRFETVGSSNDALHRDGGGIIVNDTSLGATLESCEIDGVDLAVLFIGPSLDTILESVCLFPLGLLDTVGLCLAHNGLNGLLEAGIQEHGATEASCIVIRKLLL